MKYIVAGSRTIDMGPENFKKALSLLKVHIDPFLDTVISGECPRGPDAAAKAYAHWYGIKYQGFPADWDRHGLSAGPKRNAQMAEAGDVLVLIWDGESKGSKSMKREMTKLGKPIFEMILRRPFP